MASEPENVTLASCEGTMSLPPWTPMEIMKMFVQLPPAELCRIRLSARYLSRGTGEDEDELVHEAIARLCRTEPPREIKLPVLMYQTMRSLAHCSRNSARRTRHTRGGEEERHLCTASAEQEVEELEEENRRAVRDQDAIEQIWRFFGNDAGVSAILEGISEGKSPSQIRFEAGMTQLDYNSAHRRLRRGLDKLFPGRRKSKI